LTQQIDTLETQLQQQQGDQPHYEQSPGEEDRAGQTREDQPHCQQPSGDEDQTERPLEYQPRHEQFPSDEDGTERPQKGFQLARPTSNNTAPLPIQLDQNNDDGFSFLGQHNAFDMLLCLRRASIYQHDQDNDFNMDFLGEEDAFNMLPFPGRNDLGQPSHQVALTFQHDPAPFHAQADILTEGPALHHLLLPDEAPQLGVQSSSPSVALFQAM
jgi:hypothetical protein